MDASIFLLLNLHYKPNDSLMMDIITARDFRSNQSKYLKEANEGASVIITSRQGCFRIVPIAKDDTVVNKDLWDALTEVKDHLSGKKDLPDARRLVF